MHRGDVNDPFTILLAQLTGNEKPPKARQAFQQYMHYNYREGACIADVIAKEWKAKTESEHMPLRKCNANFRSGVARRMFNELSKEEREMWAEGAKAEAAAVKKWYKEQLQTPPSTDPVACQNCLNNLGAFLGPIIEGVWQATGCQVFITIGGPMRLFDGEISIMK